MTILHVAVESDWNAATEAGSYRVSTRGLSVDEVGFIHCSTPAQVRRVAAQFYADVSEPLRVLSMEPDVIRASGTSVLYEDGGNGELYPHVYGAIDPAWVTDAAPARMVDGELLLD